MMSVTMRRAPIQSRVAPTRPAFTLVEGLIVLGVLMILISLLLPALRQTRQAARDVSGLSNIRQIAVAVAGYTTDHSDVIPTVFAPLPAFSGVGDPAQTVEVDGIRVGGWWFDNAWMYHLALRPFLPPEVLRAPEAPRARGRMSTSGARAVILPDYYLSDTFFALPSYWSRPTQFGPTQWGAQRMSRVQFPSAKGLLMQRHFYPEGIGGSGRSAPQTEPRPIAWADLSASAEAPANLRPGVPHFFHTGLVAPLPITAVGAPVIETEDGILGRDR